MKFTLLLLLAGIMAEQSLPAQLINDAQSFAGNNKRNVSYAPLSLTINGAGRIFPFYDGQMLQVGRNYLMIAVPDLGYKFAGWNRVHIFTVTSTEIDYNTDPFTTNIVTTVDISPEELIYKKVPYIEFKMESANYLYNVNGNSLTEEIGWQANFVPVIRKVHVQTQSETDNGQ
jgi:hypothetical protein